MGKAGGVSRRTEAIYERFYADRVQQRCLNLYEVFLELARIVDAAGFGARIEIDYLSLADLVRSYFLDVIRYKEYHLDFRSESSVAEDLPSNLDPALLEKLDPFDPKWAEAVHLYANINASKVAAYTVKWILRNKPISVIGVSPLSSDSEPDRAGRNAFLADINEQYALQCALVALEIDSIAIPADVLDELIYCFRFRAFDEGAYFMLLSKQYLCDGDNDGDNKDP